MANFTVENRGAHDQRQKHYHADYAHQQRRARPALVKRFTELGFQFQPEQRVNCRCRHKRFERGSRKRLP
jgi:hypothetical protein